jgi:hypothetical protein
VKLRVQVTAEDIEEGEIGVPSQCAVSMAARRALRAAGMEMFHLETVQADGMSGDFELDLDTGSGLVQVTLPREVSAFVERFDGGGPVEPIAFEVEIP